MMKLCLTNALTYCSEPRDKLARKIVKSYEAIYDVLTWRQI